MPPDGAGLYKWLKRLPFEVLLRFSGLDCLVPRDLSLLDQVDFRPNAKDGNLARVRRDNLHPVPEVEQASRVCRVIQEERAIRLRAVPGEEEPEPFLPTKVPDLEHHARPPNLQFFRVHVQPDGHLHRLAELPRHYADGQRRLPHAPVAEDHELEQVSLTFNHATSPSPCHFGSLIKSGDAIDLKVVVRLFDLNGNNQSKGGANDVCIEQTYPHGLESPMLVQYPVKMLCAQGAQYLYGFTSSLPEFPNNPQLATLYTPQ